MGVVKRQSIKATIVSYMGVAVAYLTLTVLFPKYLTESQIGLHRVIIQAGLVFAVVGAFGVPQTVVRFYSFFMRQNAERSLFGMLLVLPLIGLGVFLMLFFGFKPEILGLFEKNAPEIAQYYDLSLWIMLFFTYYLVLAAYAQVFQRIVVPKFLLEIFVRLLTLLALGGFVMAWISFEQFLVLQPVIYGVMTLALLIYLLIWRKPGFRFDLHKQKKRLLKMMFSFSAYSLFTSASGLFVIAIDSFMVTGMLGLKEVGIYSIAFYMGQIIEMPKRAVVQIIAPFLSKAWFNKDMETIGNLYRQSSINLMILGGLFFMLVWLNLGDFYALMPNGDRFKEGMGVVFFIGLARFLDMSAGANFEIIANSKHYINNLIIFGLLFVVTILGNYLLIPIYGITGAALATLISLVIYNFVGFVFIKIKMNLQPFSKASLHVLIIVVTLLVLVPFFNPGWPPFVMIFVRSLLIAGIFGTLVLRLRLSPEATQFFSQALQFLQNKLKI